MQILQTLINLKSCILVVQRHPLDTTDSSFKCSLMKPYIIFPLKATQKGLLARLLERNFWRCMFDKQVRVFHR